MSSLLLPQMPSWTTGLYIPLDSLTSIWMAKDSKHPNSNRKSSSNVLPCSCLKPFLKSYLNCPSVHTFGYRVHCLLAPFGSTTYYLSLVLNSLCCNFKGYLCSFTLELFMTSETLFTSSSCLLDRPFLICLVCSHWGIKCNNVCKAPS